MQIGRMRIELGDQFLQQASAGRCALLLFVAGNRSAQVQRVVPLSTKVFKQLVGEVIVDGGAATSDFGRGRDSRPKHKYTLASVYFGDEANELSFENGGGLIHLWSTAGPALSVVNMNALRPRSLVASPVPVTEAPDQGADPQEGMAQST